jgi:peptide/nickel transport system substrate-binding protein
VGLPAHVVAKTALRVHPANGETKSDAAKRELVAAINTGDTASLAALAHAWNSSFTATASPKLFVGDGPYRVTKVTADAVTLSANPMYSGSRKPRFEQVIVRTIADPLAQVDALRAGTVDVISPTATTDLGSAAAALPGVRVIRGVSGTYEHLDLQFSIGKSDVFDDPLVRQAFLAVVPRQQIVSTLIAPIDPAATTRDSQLFMPGSSAYGASIASNGSSRYTSVDVARATSLLTEAGVVAPTVCILFDPANPRRVAEYQMIADSASKAGFVVTNCSTPDWRGFLGVDGDYDAALFAWDQTNLAVTGPAARLQSDSTVSNFSHYSSAEADEILNELALASGRDIQTDLLTRLDAVLWKDAYGATLYQFPTITVVSNRVRGVAPSALEPGLVWNLWAWHPAPKSNE